MGKQIKTKAIVLHEMPIGDYDKRLVLLTKELGKITVFVKGVRRSNSKMLSCAQVFAYGDFIVSKGKNCYNVYEAQLIEYFHGLRMDMEDLTYGMYLMEFVDYTAHENMDNVDLMHLLLYALNAINHKRMSARLVIRIFELKAMSILGYTPWVNDCAICHDEANIQFFSTQIGGFLCHDRTHPVKDRIKINDTTVYAIRYVLSKPMKDIFSFALEQEALLELEFIMNQFVPLNLNKKFKTLDFLLTL
jgi:DNA repair protein RecO (recombination protein O)